MTLEIGNINRFIVKRETDISYTLSPTDEDLTTYVFLHFNQATRRLNPGDKISAFLYYDQKKRLCATMEEPIITTDKYAFVAVVGVHEHAGVFVNIGIAKDILVSTDFLPQNIKAWPMVGDYIPCILKVKADQLVARIVNKEDLTKKWSALEIGQTVEATVCKIIPEGLFLFTNAFQPVFIHRSLLRKKYHLGEKLLTKIIHINDQGAYNGSMIENRELARLDDRDAIYHYLKTSGGVLQLGNASTPEDINRYFMMSKSAFKRAVGALYKEKLITIDDYRITLMEKE